MSVCRVSFTAWLHKLYADKEIGLKNRMQTKKQRRNQTKMIVRTPGMHSARTDLNWTLVFPGAPRAAQRVGADER